MLQEEKDKQFCSGKVEEHTQTESNSFTADSLENDDIKSPHCCPSSAILPGVDKDT